MTNDEFKTQQMAHRLYRAAIDILALSCLDEAAADIAVEWLQTRALATSEERAALDSMIRTINLAAEDA